MANRHTLHISKLDDFKEWLVKDGWEIEDPKGIYEVLRARKPGRKNPIIVYKKLDTKEHLSLMDRDIGVVKAFLRDARNPKTNADRIRSMSDQDIEEFFVKEIRNKAIDDFRTEICNMIVQSERNGNYRFYAVEIKQLIADLGEQLKGGGVNE